MDLDQLNNDATRFFDKVAANLNRPDDYNHAFRVVKTVFEVVRDTVETKTSEEIMDNLPWQVSDIYEEGWDPELEKEVFKNSEEFYNRLRDYSETVDLDFYDDTEARQALQAVFSAMRDFLPAKVYNDLKMQLPEPVNANV